MIKTTEEAAEAAAAEEEEEEEEEELIEEFITWPRAALLFEIKTQIIDADNLIASPFHSSGEGIRRGSIRVTSELVPHYFSATSTLLNQMKGDKCNLSSRTGNLQFMAQDQCSVSIKVDDFLPNLLFTHTRL